MSLLSGIISSIDDKSVPALLRQVTILASRLQSEPLAEWVHFELNGYPDLDKLPDYRGPFPSEVIGKFMLPYTSSMSTLPIAPIGFPPEQRDSFAFKVAFLQPVAELEAALADQTRLKEMQYPWTADYVAYVNLLMRRGEVSSYPNAALFSASRPVNPTQLAGIVDAVRTRLLSFALAMEEIEPTAGEPNGTPPPPGEVTNIFNTYITNSTVSVAQASQNVTQTVATEPVSNPTPPTAA